MNGGRDDLLEVVLESLPARVFWKDRESRFLGGNAAFAAYVGLPAAEIVGKTDFDFASPSEAARYIADDREVMETGVARPTHDETVALPDGRRLVVRISKVPLRDAAGRVVGVIGMFEDVSEVRTAEDHARASEARYRAFVEQSPLATQVVGRDGKTRSVNAAWERLFGVPFASLTAYDMRSDPQLARQGLLAAIERAFAGETVSVPSSEYDLDAQPDASGATGRRWVSSVLYGVKGDGDAIDEIVIVHEDLTAGRLAEAALDASEQKYRGIFDESVAAILVVDGKRQFVDANQAGLELLGYSRDELLELRLSDVLASPEAEIPVRDELLATGRIVNYEHGLRRKDGRVVTVLNNARTIRGRDGVIGMQSTLVDITERKRAEAERERLRADLEAAQRLESVGRLAGGVAHDHNNMLGVILGSATAALELLEPGHPAREELEEVLDAASRSAELTKQLLGFARRQPATPAVLDVDERLSAALKMLSRLVREDVRLELAPGRAVPCVRIDPAQLDQVMVNLVANARDAIAGAGTIRLETSSCAIGADEASSRGLAPGEYVALRVTDDGAGMPDDVREHAFEPFFTTKRAGEGTGLGLATVYGIVKQNGGDVSLASAPGSGTTITILLPAHARASATVPPSARARRGGTESVLLVEDEPAVLRLVERTLARLGYRVATARSPAEAIHLASRADASFDLLLTDVIMPGMSGRQLADALAETRPAMRRVFMSGYPADELSREGLIPHGTFFLAKPFTVETLSKRVREALEAPGPG